MCSKNFCLWKKKRWLPWRTKFAGFLFLPEYGIQSNLTLPKFFFTLYCCFFDFFFVKPKNQGVKNSGKKVPKSTKIFWGVFWIQFVIFFAFITFGTYLNQNGPRFCKIWPKLTLLKFLVTFYYCFFFGQIQDF